MIGINGTRKMAILSMEGTLSKLFSSLQIGDLLQKEKKKSVFF